MAITIDWGTKVINIPKNDTTLIQSSPTEIRELDLNTFRLALKDLEDNEAGIPFLNTHNHNPPVSVGGVTLARVIEIINGYTITFEDGQYAVNLSGANSNVADNVNVNQVSVRSANSAGMTSSPAIEYASFNGGVTIDVDNGYSGTAYPSGTPTRPVNNLYDAKLILSYRGLQKIYLKSSLTIVSGESIQGLTLESDNWLELTIEDGAISDDAIFNKLSIMSAVLGGYWNVFNDCWIYSASNFCGWMRNGSFSNISLAAYTVESAGQSFFDDIVPMYGGISSSLAMNTNVSVSFTNCKDICTIYSMTNGSNLIVGLRAGELIIDSSCVGGDITVAGTGVATNNSLLIIDDTGLISQDTVTHAVWNESLAEHQTTGTSGKALSTASTGGVDVEVLADAIWDKPISENVATGTFGEFLQKKLLTVAKFIGLK